MGLVYGENEERGIIKDYKPQILPPLLVIMQSLRLHLQLLVGQGQLLAVSVSLFPPVTNNASLAGSSISDRNFCREGLDSIVINFGVNNLVVKSVH